MNSISQIRSRLGVTQTALASALGVTQGNVSNYEHGQNMPPDIAKRLVKFAAKKKVRVTLDEIYRDTPA